MKKEFELAMWKGGALMGVFGLLHKLIQASGAKDERAYAKFSVIASLAAGIAVLPVLGPIFSIASFFLIMAFLLFVPVAVAHSIREDVEKKLVPALYAASRMPSSLSAIDVLSRLAEQKRELGILGDIFGEAYGTLVKSAGRRGLEEIFAGISSKIGSKKLERVFLALSVGMNSPGTGGGLLMLKSAEDLEDIQLLSEKKSASLASQKYIILLGSALLVPFILGAVQAMMAFFSTLGPALSGMGIGNVASGGSALGRAMMGYVAIQAALSSVWVAYSIDEKPSLAAVYLPVLVASALVVYWFATRIITT